jgi:hypothetical protein
MLHALALAAVALATPPTPSTGGPSSLTPQKSRCEAASMDPSFVHYVPPALHANGPNALLWWVSAGVRPQPALRTRFGAPPLLNCLHPLQVRDDR